MRDHLLGLHHQTGILETHMTSRQTPSKSPDKPPAWRVEGMPDADKDSSGWRSRLPGRWFWAIVVVLFAINWIVTTNLLEPEQPILVPYTDFVAQLEADNVASVESVGDTITGMFRKEIT